MVSLSLLTDPPKITITPSSPHMTLVGSQLHIKCTANGSPTPTVQWFRSGVAVSQVAMKSLQYSVVPTQPQSIVYICVAKNNAGNVSRIIHADIIVNVIGNLQCVHMLVTLLQAY